QTKNPNYNHEILFRKVNNEWKKYKNIQKIIDEFNNTPIPLQGFSVLYTRHLANSQVDTLIQTVQLPTQEQPEMPHTNALAQKETYNQIKEAKKKFLEFISLYSTTNDFQLHRNLYGCIKRLKNNLEEKKNKLNELKRNASYQQKCRLKKKNPFNEKQ
ncbi:4451_t:CDS:1, partial [Racocetra persica]